MNQKDISAEAVIDAFRGFFNRLEDIDKTNRTACFLIEELQDAINISVPNQMLYDRKIADRDKPKQTIELPFFLIRRILDFETRRVYDLSDGVI